MFNPPRTHGEAYEIRQVNMPVSIQQHIIRLDVPVYDVLSVYISYCATELGNPESDRLFGEGLSRYVES